MGELQKRGGYTPRRVRERRAYQLAVAGSVAGAVGVVGIALAVIGVVGSWLPVIALIIAAACVLGFVRSVGGRSAGT
jgi:CHASE2 domain-containing sensor protein